MRPYSRPAAIQHGCFVLLRCEAAQPLRCKRRSSALMSLIARTNHTMVNRNVAMQQSKALDDDSQGHSRVFGSMAAPAGHPAVAKGSTLGATR